MDPFLLANIEQTFIIFTKSLGISTLFAYPIYKLLIHLKAKQTISKHLPENHQIKNGTPNMGGLIIFPGFLISILYSPYFTSATVPLKYSFIAISFGILGVVDDTVIPRISNCRGFHWITKIILQFIIAAISIYMTEIHTFPLPFLHPYFEYLLGILYILFFVNAVNFTDGLDGLALIVTSLYATFIINSSWILFLNGNYYISILDISIVLTALIGGIIPLKILNSYPAKIFMGDTGSMTIGAILGLASWQMIITHLSKIHIEQTNLLDFLFSSNALIIYSTFVASLLLFVELILVPIKLFFIKTLKWYLPIRTPLHHGLEAFGWPETKITHLFSMIQFLLGLLGFYMILHI